jgi:DNA repair protein RadD
MFTLRPYQTDFVTRIGRQYATGKRRVLGVSPTGSGKTVMFAHITSGTAAKGYRCCIAAHRGEIVDQISDALTAMGVQHGMIRAGRKTPDDAVCVAMIQTLANRVKSLAPPDLLVFDEAHHAIAASYMKILEAWAPRWVLGVTATPLRLDGRGLGHAFDSMVVGPSTGELIRDGHLAAFEYYAGLVTPDLSGVRSIGGDYAEDQLADAVDRKHITGDAIEHYRRHLLGRPAIAFCVRVSHAEHVAEQFREAGFRAASVDGEMSRAERETLIRGIGNGELDVLTSCALISEGLDVPSVGGVILLRPTQSLGLHLQQIGRALRPKTDGLKAIVLDHVGNVGRHGMPDAARLWTLEDQPKRSQGDIECRVDGCGWVFKNRPDWKAHVLKLLAETGQSCPFPDHNQCALRATEGQEGGVVVPPLVVPGTLQRLNSGPEWAKGCDLLTARGAEFVALLAHADTVEKLEQIRILRGYKPGWTWWQLEKRRRGET